MKMISNIVFTKNRPLQLDGYLTSLYRYFPAELIQTYIIYKVELFEQEYQQLFQKYSNCTVIREGDFHSDFLRLLAQIDTKYILFGVDDVVYFDSVDLGLIDETFNRFSDSIFGFSLRFSKQIIEESKDTIIEHEIASQTIYSINWTQGQTSTTRYPFELCATIYRTEMVKKVINSSRSAGYVAVKLFSPNSLLIKGLKQIGRARKVLKKFGFFYSPNTLESWNCRWCQHHSNLLPAFLYFQKLCASAIQVNMVNVSTANIINGSIEHTVETLAKKYKQGYRLDIDFIAANKPARTHCGSRYFKLVKT